MRACLALLGLLTAATQAAPPLKDAAAAGCPMLPGWEDARLHVTHVTAKGIRLLVCGTYGAGMPKNGREAYLDTFVIFAPSLPPESRQVHAVAPNPDEHEGDNRNFHIVSRPRKELAVREQLLFGEKWYPFTSQAIECDASRCRLGKPRCILEAPRNPHPGIMAELKRALGRKDATGKLRVDLLVHRAYEQAMGGDREARGFFLAPSPAAALDAHAAEVFASDREQVLRARAAGCF